MRSTTHWPAGGVQSSDPSLPIFDVRSTTSLFRTASAGGMAGVPRSERPASGTKAAFSSNRVTRAPVCSTSSATWCSAGGGGSGRSISIGGAGGGVTNATLK